MEVIATRGSDSLQIMNEERRNRLVPGKVNQPSITIQGYRRHRRKCAVLLHIDGEKRKGWLYEMSGWR